MTAPNRNFEIAGEGGKSLVIAADEADPGRVCLAIAGARGGVQASIMLKGRLSQVAAAHLRAAADTARRDLAAQS